jgi:hypothetical protein
MVKMNQSDENLKIDIPFQTINRNAFPKTEHKGENETA